MSSKTEKTEIRPPIDASEWEKPYGSERPGPLARFFATDPFKPRADRILLAILKAALLAGFIAWEIILIISFARLMI